MKRLALAVAVSSPKEVRTVVASTQEGCIQLPPSEEGRYPAEGLILLPFSPFLLGPELRSRHSTGEALSSLEKAIVQNHHPPLAPP